ncbi:unnamed protein product [Rotaria sordida]|uniref:Uncharacterized protein n=1 Tax=Rotaria sordida TaxID=392033 RepID=A0A819VB76_9BILA|nr:unnamed protein product [Rotaria sordida]CAF4106523.1 unnamed protein product [Rotaria sordida]
MKELATALELNASSYRTIARWEKRLHEKGEDVNNDLQSGRLVFEFTDVNCELLKLLSIMGTIERIMHNCLKMRKVAQ